MHNNRSPIMGLLHAPKGDVASAMANAPIIHPETPKGPATVAPAALGIDGAKVPLPSPVFALVGNPKAYPDRSDASKSNSRIAFVALTSGICTFEASIYLETKITQREDGRHEENAIRFSMPKGVKLLDVIPAERIDAWKDSIIDGYLAWRKASGGALKGAKHSAGFRTIETAAAPNPA